MITQFTVEYVNHPDGKFKASLKGKDQDGRDMKLSMGKHSLAPFQKGQTYLIDYERKSFQKDNGDTVYYYAFNGIVDGGAEIYPGLAEQDEDAQIAALQKQKAEKARAKQEAQRKHDEQEHEWQVHERERSMWMAVTGCMSRAAGNGAKPEDLEPLAVAAVKAFKKAELAADGYVLHPSTVAAGGAPVGPIPNVEEGDPGPRGGEIEDTIPFAPLRELP